MQDARAVLDAEFGGRLDVVYEGVGGGLFRAALANLSPTGRLLSVGYISARPGSGTSLCAPGLRRRCTAALWAACSWRLLHLGHSVSPEASVSCLGSALRCGICS